MLKMKTGIAVAMIAAVSLASGCNTFKGAGKDVQGAGRGIEKTADKTQDKIEDKKAEHKAEKKHHHSY